MPKLQRVEFWFTKQYSQFGFLSQGQATTGPTPSGSGQQFLIGGPDITEQFVTGGRISSQGVSYLINPLSRRTV